MTRRTVLVVVATLIALGAAGAVVALATQNGGGTKSRAAEPGRTVQATREKTYAELVAANYKVLKPTQTQRLLAYANAAYACLSKQLAIGKPKPSPTKIVMALPPGANGFAVARLGIKCSKSIGDPPDHSTFQIRGHNVILYLPKYCILDKKTVQRRPQSP
jgi:hypothetical protein